MGKKKHLIVKNNGKPLAGLNSVKAAVVNAKNCNALLVKASSIHCKHFSCEVIWFASLPEKSFFGCLLLQNLS